MTAPSPKPAWSSRQTIAFHLGLAILPVFWIWWMASPRFSQVQRGLAAIWTGMWLTGVAMTWTHLQPYYAELLWTYPYVCASVTLSLAALLILRSRDWLGIFMLWFVFGGVAHHFVDAVAASAGDPHHTFFWTLALIAVAALHLLPASRSSEDVH